MISSMTRNLKRKLAELALNNAKEQGIEHITNGPSTVAVRHTVVEVILAGYSRDEHRFTLSFNDRRPDEQLTYYPSVDIIMAYLSDDSMPYAANDGLSIWSNQAHRDATVLAVDGNELILEYEMPAGSTALLSYLVRNGELTRMRNHSYKGCPKRWIRLIRAGGMNWTGQCQRNGRVPLPDLAVEKPKPVQADEGYLIREDLMHAAEVVAREYRDGVANDTLSDAVDRAHKKLESFKLDRQTILLMAHAINAHEYVKAE